MDLLSVGQVDSSEERVVLGSGFSLMILIEEDGRAAHLDAQLLHALLVINGEQEGLTPFLCSHRRYDGEIGWKDGRCKRREIPIIGCNTCSTKSSKIYL